MHERSAKVFKCFEHPLKVSTGFRVPLKGSVGFRVWGSLSGFFRGSGFRVPFKGLVKSFQGFTDRQASSLHVLSFVCICPSVYICPCFYSFVATASFCRLIRFVVHKAARL